MRDQVSWAFYIGNFTFLVGVAAAAVLLVIPAYVYQWKPIKEVVILGELLAISAIVMCLLFVLVDIGPPGPVLHIMPPLGTLNLPRSILAWDVVVLNAYLLLNLVVVLYLLFKTFMRRALRQADLVLPLVLLSIPMAIAIHTVTAFLYNGLAARPYWNASILAPRFLASAFCSGPAVLLILLQILRPHTRFQIQDEAIWKIAELMAYAMFLNLFLHGAELFKEYYSTTEHLLYTQYWFQGIGEHRTLVPYAWLSLACSVARSCCSSCRGRGELRHAEPRLPAHLGGRLHREGDGPHHPGLHPDTLGEIYEKTRPRRNGPSGGGVWGGGFVVIAVVKNAVPILVGTFRSPERMNPAGSSTAGFPAATDHAGKKKGSP